MGKEAWSSGGDPIKGGLVMVVNDLIKFEF
jgi:hypothetical protein